MLFCQNGAEEIANSEDLSVQKLRVITVTDSTMWINA